MTYNKNFFDTKGGERLAYYLTSDDKPLLCLIHGNYSKASVWFSLMEQFEDDYSVLAVDMRGYGDSSWNNPVDSLEPLADDLIEVIKGLGFTHGDFIAWSLGGGVAMELAAKEPDMVDHLVLTASMGVQGYPMFEFDMETMTPKLDKPLTTKEEIAASMYYVPMKQLIDTEQDELLGQTFQAMFVKHPPTGEFLDDCVLGMKQQQHLLDMDYALLQYNITGDNNGNFDGSDRLKNITAPVLVLHGENDNVVPPELAQLNKQYFGDQAELNIFEEAGHGLHLDQPEQWIEAVRSFLE
ncbi:MAG: alpha/beta hydrolase [Eubacteriales bacterium]|nr:alpha/beta hydrolase [Eubacteriales bacterium]MDD4323411.1 alpha/beta hydrolase [Eubacteriales bacterium]MDD4541871.1 alpha/beta hydrolase [Eubacteriales bacterium]